MSLIPIRGNWLGLILFVAAAPLIILPGVLLRFSEFAIMLTVGGALTVADLAIRLRSRATKGWLRRPDAGGYFFFVPVWVLGLVVIAVNVANRFVR